MSLKNVPQVSLVSLSILAMSFGAVACSDNADNGEGDTSQGDGDGDDTAGGAGGMDGAGDGDAEVEPVYLFTVSTWDLDGNATLYGLLRNELDFRISASDLTDEKAYVFPGYTGVAVIDGDVVTGESSRPFAEKFEITDDLKWKAVGGELNFSDYVNDDTDGLNFYFQAIRGTDMYLFYGSDRSSRKHWNTSEWKLKEEYTATALPTRSGFTLGSTGNRTGMRDWKGPIFQTFNMSDDESGLGADQSWIAVYDEKTHEETAVLEVPCPGLAQQTMDEDGRVYVSTTYNAPTLALYGEQPFSCVVRLNADGTLDEDFGENDMSDWTDGSYGVNFRYLKEGKGVANILHHDRIEDVDWEGDVQPEVVVQVEGEWTDDGYTPQDVSLWDLEVIDLEKGSSKKITGFEDGHDEGSYSIFFQVEDRVFMSFQIDPFGDARNAMYELDVDTADLTYLGMIDGELGSVARVR